MRLLVTGDRDWSNRKVIFDALSPLPKDTVIIHGVARGADTLAAECALELGLLIDLPPTPFNRLGGYQADWQRYGRAAGPVRNQEMLKAKPDSTWAFHDSINDSRGTKDMMTRSIRAAVPTYLYMSDGSRYTAERVLKLAREQGLF